MNESKSCCDAGSGGPSADDDVSACCATGHLDSGTPGGEIVVIGGLQTYCAAPPSSSSPSPSSCAIVLFTDVFGFGLRNVRLIADAYSKATGLPVFVPDLHEGDSLHPEVWDGILLHPQGAGFGARVLGGLKFAASLPSLISWFSRHGDGVTLPLVARFLVALRAERGVGRVGGVGYCWGGRYVVLASGEAPRAAGAGLDAYVACHPSGLSIPKDIDVPQKDVPGYFALAESDGLFPAAKGSAAVAARGGKTVCRVFGGTRHGFAVRGDERDPVVAAARADALAETAAFLKKSLCG
jgi:dienelactone hydrolase